LSETVWKIRIGLDLGCSEWPKQGEDVPSHPLEPLNTANEELSAIFQTVSQGDKPEIHDIQAVGLAFGSSNE
jgi:hypothetical protein